MEIKIQDKEEVYETLCKWWEQWSFPIIPLESLPKKIFTVYKKGVGLYSIPLYLTNSNICWMGFPTSNKEVSKEDKEGQLSNLLKFVEESARQMGYGILLTTSDTPRIMETLEQGGYSKSDEGTNYYTKQL